MVALEAVDEVGKGRLLRNEDGILGMGREIFLGGDDEAVDQIARGVDRLFKKDIYFLKKAIKKGERGKSTRMSWAPRVPTSFPVSSTTATAITP